jgi:two-component system sensor histidine kinase PhoQ
MDEIIEHQLQRAAVSGRATLASAVPLQPVLERLLRSLDKVYRDKQVDVSRDLDPAATFYGDEADLTEVLGNLLDNAYKYCSSQVRVYVRSESKAASGHGLEISIEDDGHGIDPGMIDTTWAAPWCASTSMPDSRTMTFESCGKPVARVQSYSRVG